MTTATTGSVDRLHGLVEARELIARALDNAVREALAAGAPVEVVARALGMHRATFYRRYAFLRAEPLRLDELNQEVQETN